MTQLTDFIRDVYIYNNRFHMCRYIYVCIYILYIYIYALPQKIPCIYK